MYGQEDHKGRSYHPINRDSFVHISISLKSGKLIEIMLMKRKI